MPRIRLTEEMKVTINLGLLITLVVGVVGMSFAVGTKLAQFESRMAAVELSNMEHMELRADVDANSAAMADQNVRLAEIQTDLKWIRAKMEEDD